jgi:hypothetical protein
MCMQFVLSLKNSKKQLLNVMIAVEVSRLDYIIMENMLGSEQHLEKGQMLLILMFAFVIGRLKIKKKIIHHFLKKWKLKIFL